MNFVLFIGILLVLGLASTRVMKIVKLPNVTGYLIVGLLAALICVLIDNINPETETLSLQLTNLNSMVSVIALGFIALSIGEEFKVSKIKQYGTKIITITLLQAFGAIILVDGALIGLCLALHLDLSIAICLGAIATATAPAATLMVIHQYKAKGPLVDILLPVVAFDDAIGLVVFSISVAIAKVLAVGTPITISSVCLIPLLEIVGSLVVGFILGVLMHFAIRFFKSRNNHAVVIIAFTLLGVGACEALNTITINGETLEFSNLLCCMMVGASYINLAKENELSIVNRDIELVDRWTPFLFMLFFVLSGAHLVTSAKSILETSESSILVPIMLVFITYIITRSLGKYLGARIGAKITKREKTIVKYLGITLLPQAGVAIGMANQVSGIEAFSTNNIGNIIVTVVLCATLVYELVGPVLTKMSLNKAGEIPDQSGNYPYQNNNKNN